MNTNALKIMREAHEKISAIHSPTAAHFRHELKANAMLRDRINANPI